MTDRAHSPVFDSYDANNSHPLAINREDRSVWIEHLRSSIFRK